MRGKKIGLLALALVLALGALGVGYASWTDTITIDGTVNTGSVDLNVVDYSGTYVYKVPGDFDNDEIWVWHGWLTVPFEEPQGKPGYPAPFEVASATALPNGDDAVLVTFTNAFPCTELTADILIHYDGSVPAMVDAVLTGCQDLTLDNGVLDCDLLANYVQVHFYESDASGTQGTEITEAVQMHKCNYVLAVMSLHLPQDDAYMNLGCSFTAELQAVQWNKEYGD